MTGRIVPDGVKCGALFHPPPCARYDALLMETTPCLRCGKANDSDAAFCRRCGVALDVVPNSAAAAVAGAAPPSMPEGAPSPFPLLRPVNFSHPEPRSSPVLRFGLV